MRTTHKGTTDGAQVQNALSHMKNSLFTAMCIFVFPVRRDMEQLRRSVSQIENHMTLVSRDYGPAHAQLTWSLADFTLLLTNSTRSYSDEFYR